MRLAKHVTHALHLEQTAHVLSWLMICVGAAE